MKQLLDTINHGDIVIKVFEDGTTVSPRLEDKNLGTMVMWHPRYKDLGDKHTFETHQEFLEYTEKVKCLVLPVYLVEDIEGIRVVTWLQKGQELPVTGYIYVPYKDLHAKYHTKRIGYKLRADAEKHLEREVRAYNTYLNNSRYGFVVEDTKGNIIDSAWGIVGNKQEREDQVDKLARSYTKFKFPAITHQGSHHC